MVQERLCGALKDYCGSGTKWGGDIGTEVISAKHSIDVRLKERGKEDKQQMIL